MRFPLRTGTLTFAMTAAIAGLSEAQTVKRFSQDEYIGAKYAVPLSWNKIVIERNVTITGSFYVDNTRSAPLEICGEDRKTSILRGTGHFQFAHDQAARQHSGIRVDGSPTLYVHDLTSLDPDKWAKPNAISLRWDDVSDHDDGTNDDESYFDVRRSSASSGWTSIGLVPAGTVTFVDTSLTESTTYSYKVHAVSQPSGAFDWTPILTVLTPNGSVAPTNPSELSAPTVTDQYVELTWTDNSDNEEEFEIRRQPAGSSPTAYVTIGTVDVNTTQFFDYTVQSATSYDYKIHARNGTGIGWTYKITVTTQ